MKPGVAKTAHRSGRRRTGEVLLALFFAAASLRLYFLLLGPSFVRSALVGEAIVHGEPPWPIFQSRVLGPYIVHALGVLTGQPPPAAYAIFAVLTLFATGLCVFKLGRALDDTQRPPMISFLAFQGGLIVLLPCIWLYSWDLISLIVFAVFNYLVVAGARWRTYAALVAAALLNHELTLAIALWMLLDPLVKRLFVRPSARAFKFDRAMAIAGAVLLVAGGALLVALRRLLLVRVVPPPDAAATQSAFGGNLHLTLLQNAEALSRSFTLSPQAGYPFVVPAFILAVIVLAVRLAYLDVARFGALALVTLAMVASFLCFGLVFETRVLLPLVPFIAMHGWAGWRGSSAS
jgi:hypothetical protein